MIEKIKEKLNSIPIFFEEEKAYILSKIEGKSESFLNSIYEELIEIENHVGSDEKKLKKHIQDIEDKIIIDIEAKKREIIRKMIQTAEENDDD